MTDLGHVGVRLKTARMAAGFKSAKEFCEKHNICSSTYSLHETGGRNLKPKIAQKYSDILEINVAWLLTGSGLPYKAKKSIEDMTISDTEFSELLKYNGNKDTKAHLHYKNEILNNVNPLLLCKIISNMTDIMRDLSFHLDLDQLSKKALEIYKDITSSNDNQEIQLSMVDLSITTFKRQLQEMKINSLYTTKIL